MKYFKKVCLYHRAVVTFNADKDKYTDWEISTNGNTIRNVCGRCNGIKRLNLFGVPTIFRCRNGGYNTVKFLDMIVLKDNASIKLIVDDESELLASASGKTLPVDKSHHHISDITIQRNVNRRNSANSSTSVINRILSMCRNCYQF